MISTESNGTISLHPTVVLAPVKPSEPDNSPSFLSTKPNRLRIIHEELAKFPDTHHLRIGLERLPKCMNASLSKSIQIALRIGFILFWIRQRPQVSPSIPDTPVECGNGRANLLSGLNTRLCICNTGPVASDALRSILQHLRPVRVSFR